MFMDVEGQIKPGDDFVKVLNDQVAQCDVLLAIIGERWIGARDADGSRRLEKESDFVRIEIASALTQGKRVIPVLVNKAEMPRADELPPSLKPLAPQRGRDPPDAIQGRQPGLCEGAEGCSRSSGPGANG